MRRLERTPLRDWLLDPGAKGIRSILQSREGLLASYLNRDALSALLERHDRGVEDATDRIWRLLNLQIWGEIFLAGRRDPMRDSSGEAALWPRS